MTSAQSSLNISLCRFCSPRYVDFDELERKFWKNLTFNPPLYGADVSGTLYDPVSVDRLHTWNLNILNSVCGRQVGLLKNVVYTFLLCQCYYLSICDKSLSDRISWLSENLSSGAYLQVQCLDCRLCSAASVSSEQMKQLYLLQIRTSLALQDQKDYRSQLGSNEL